MPAPKNTTKVFASSDVKIEFPKAQRTSTKLSPYLDDVDAMVNKGSNKHYPVSNEQEFKELANQLRSVARRVHNAALQIVFVPKDTPTHKKGVYARHTGPITPKPRKASQTVTKATQPAKATATTKKASPRTRKA